MIITRYFSAASLGLLVTTSLLYLMQLLIDISPGMVTDAPPRIVVEWIKPKTEEHLVVREQLPDRIAPAAMVPPDPRHSEQPNATGTSVLRPSPVLPANPAHELFQGILDGPLVSVIKVRPNYPVAAISKGLQGFVTVQFDVTANGTVGNVFVVESSHNVFESAAIEAAYRFRYKPRIINGVPQETHGLQNRFVFELDD
jgi:protein TonB